MGHLKPLTKRKKATIAAKSAGLCFYCGSMLLPAIQQKPKSASFDHIIPYCEGGTIRIENLVLSCRDCNHDKGNLSYEAFRTKCGGIFFAERYGFKPDDIPMVPEAIRDFCRNITMELENDFPKESLSFSKTS